MNRNVIRVMFELLYDAFTSSNLRGTYTLLISEYLSLCSSFYLNKFTVCSGMRTFESS